MKSGFLKEMKSRGYLNQCTDLEKLDKHINATGSSEMISLKLDKES